MPERKMTDKINEVNVLNTCIDKLFFNLFFSCVDVVNLAAMVCVTSVTLMNLPLVSEIPWILSPGGRFPVS